MTSLDTVPFVLAVRYSAPCADHWAWCGEIYDEVSGFVINRVFRLSREECIHGTLRLRAWYVASRLGLMPEAQLGRA